MKHNNNKSLICNGFTLAEVLITLGIIGVVMAMTLPILIQSHKERELSARLQKFYSVMNQAIMLEEVKSGDRKEWFEDLYGLDEEEKSKNHAWVKRHIAPHLHIIKEKQYSYGMYAYHLKDGGAFMNASSNGRDWIFFPGNPDRCIAKYGLANNKGYGICKFAFHYSPNSTSTKRGREFAPYNYTFDWDISMDTLYNHPQYGCRTGWGAYCTLLLQQNGWKVPKDYPHRIWY